MIHLGDITKIDGHRIQPVDIITGGSPCQDLSVAGKRAGLDGERSGLFMEQIRIVKEMRDATANVDIRLVKPRYMVWENVPGAFSSNQGKDFQAVLTEIIRIAEPDAPDVPLPAKWGSAGLLYDKLGRWSVAWRVHDAQFWGVPQRRKRIALVADFAGLSAGEILFERKGMSGDTEESGKERERTSDDTEDSVNETSWGFEPGAARRLDPETRFNEELSPTLRSEMGDNQVAAVYVMSSFDSNAMKSGNPHSGIYEAETSRTLDLNGGNPACNQGGMMVVQSAGFDGNMGAKTGNIGYEEEKAPTLKAPTLNAGKQMHCVCLNDQGGSSISVSYDVIGTLRAQEHGHQPIVLEGNGSRPSHRGDGYAESETMYTLNSTEHHAVCKEEPTMIEMTSTKNTIVEDGISPTLTARMGTGGNQVNAVCMDVGFFTSHEEQAGTLLARQYKDPPVVMCGPIVVQNPIVRRLTPLECERLQGFPDGWTDIGDWTDSNGKKHKAADSPRYKALGNSIALPFWRYLARRIMAQYEHDVTMGSLFDGIGGFPYVFQQCGCRPVWASEIEEFPMAVTKEHFPDE